MASFSEEGTAQLLFTPRRPDVSFIVRLGDGVVSSDGAASQNFISDGGPQSFLKLFRYVVGRAPHARERVTKTFIISGELLNAIQ